MRPLSGHRAPLAASKAPLRCCGRDSPLFPAVGSSRLPRVAAGYDTDWFVWNIKMAISFISCVRAPPAAPCPLHARARARALLAIPILAPGHATPLSRAPLIPPPAKKNERAAAAATACKSHIYEKRLWGATGVPAPAVRVPGAHCGRCARALR